MGSLPNSGRNSVAAAIGGETKSLSSCRNSLASKIQESIISIKDIKAITFEKRSRQSSVASKDVPKLAINGEEASVDEDPFFMIEAFLLEDVPDPDMEDMEEDEYLASLNDEESPGSPNEEPHASATPIRGRLQSLAALFKSKESLNDSRSNLSRTGSSIFGIGSIKSLANSVIGGIGATSTSSPKKKRPPRARMGSARSNFSLRSDSSNRNHGDKSEGGNRDSVHARERVVSIDSISIVEEEGDVALSPSFDGASPIAGARKASFEVSVHKQEDKTFIQDGRKELGTGGLFVTPRTDIPTKNIFNRSGSNSSASNLTPFPHHAKSIFLQRSDQSYRSIVAYVITTRPNSMHLKYKFTIKHWVVL
ncbi:hypothetical protein BC829DRAFT_388723 [Chytridium lagenaria]|nr:hypothetical protein BC829DRAFT_388723 [Chytridium lagenaria]